jgi:hypothetical protein
MELVPRVLLIKGREVEVERLVDGNTRVVNER